MAENILTVKNLTVLFENKKKNKKQNPCVTAVDQVCLSVKRKEIFGIVGESGCGKTTLSRGILGLIKNVRGQVLLDGENIRNPDRRKRRALTGKIQMIFQNPLASFHPRYTIRKSLYEVGRVHEIPKQEVQKKLDDLLKYTGLADSLLNHYPGQLSGGQLQRLAICRALILEPDVLVADEAVSALDISIQAHILNLLLYLREKLGITIVFISHDLNVVEHICDTVAVMYLGTIVEQGDKVELFGNTKHPYTKLLISSKTRETPDAKKSPVFGKADGEFEDVPNIFEIPVGCKFAARCPQFVKDVCDVKEPKLKKTGKNHYAACHFVTEDQNDYGIYMENI